MDTLDIIISILVLIPALLGLKNGLLRSIFSLAGIITGLFIATRYNDSVTSFFSFLKFEPKVVSFISFIAIVLFIYFISVYAAGKISGLNSVTKTFDRLLGAVFGIFKGLIIASLFLILTTKSFDLFSKETVSKSKFYADIVRISPQVYDFIIKLFPDAKNFYEELNNLIFTQQTSL